MAKKPNHGKSHTMAPNKSNQPANPTPRAQPSSSYTGSKPRISFKNALILMTICSLVLACLTAYQYVPAIGWLKGILNGLLYGVMVWGVFFLALLFFRWLRKKQGL
jgi:hypothetical protein